jgi:drug/metabolite transporter (DMT)-like permease
LGLGLLGVAIFALTLPMTRLAVGSAQSPQLPPGFVTIGRAAVAGLLSLAWLVAIGARRPPRHLWPALAVCALGTVLGFPLGLALALREVPAMHAAVITGILPLATAGVAAVALRQTAPVAFWWCALCGCALVIGFAAAQGGGHLQAGDGYLLAAVLSAAIGYVAGARVSSEIPAQHTICWVLIGALPLTAPLALAWWPAQPARPAAWLGFAYVSVFSMWLGFFAWYRALALGGVIRISQVQLLQPFLAVLFAVPILGEPLDGVTVLFTGAVIGVVAASQRLARRPASVDGSVGGPASSPAVAPPCASPRPPQQP